MLYEVTSGSLFKAFTVSFKSLSANVSVLFSVFTVGSDVFASVASVMPSSLASENSLFESLDKELLTSPFPSSLLTIFILPSIVSGSSSERFAPGVPASVVFSGLSESVLTLSS